MCSYHFFSKLGIQLCLKRYVQLKIKHSAKLRMRKHSLAANYTLLCAFHYMFNTCMCAQHPHHLPI